MSISSSWLDILSFLDPFVTFDDDGLVLPLVDRFCEVEEDGGPCRLF